MNRGDLVGYATHRALTAGSEKGSEIHLMKRTDAACLTQAVFANDRGFWGGKKSNPVVKTDAVEMCDNIKCVEHASPTLLTLQMSDVLTWPSNATSL